MALFTLFVAVCLPDKPKEMTLITEDEDDPNSSDKREDSEPSTTV